MVGLIFDSLRDPGTPVAAGRASPGAAAARAPALILRITCSGRAAPDLAGLAGAGAPVRLLQAGIERIQGHAVGRMLVAVPAEDPGAEARLRTLGGDVERVGYVPADAAVG
ncbi:NIL domain-containing protein [Methylobacterium mesophilicum]|uniref:NIL domain-containing protein n=1 Tax=Methylobacterium mesophilicum TaxID=39956 RepID=UPI002F35BE29